MSELIVEFLREINILQLLAIGVMFWFFYTRLDRKIDKTYERIDKLSDKVEDVDRRLCRIEGSLAYQGHCLYSQRNQPEKLAE